MHAFGCRCAFTYEGERGAAFNESSNTRPPHTQNHTQTIPALAFPPNLTQGERRAAHSRCTPRGLKSASFGYVSTLASAITPDARTPHTTQASSHLTKHTHTQTLSKPNSKGERRQLHVFPKDPAVREARPGYVDVRVLSVHVDGFGCWGMCWSVLCWGALYIERPHAFQMHTNQKQVPPDRPLPDAATLASLPTILKPPGTDTTNNTTDPNSARAPTPPPPPAPPATGSSDSGGGGGDVRPSLTQEELARLLATIHGEEGEKIEIPAEVAAAGAAVGDVMARVGAGGGGVEVVFKDEGEGKEGEEGR